MANFHLHAKIISRGKGHNSIAAAAYRRAANMKDSTEDKKYNYSKKSEVVFSEISIPEDSPQLVKDISENSKGHNSKSSELLWNRVEQFETRVNSQLAREIEFSLPIELTLEQNIELAKNYIERNIVSHGMIADWSFHNKKGNPHIHVMIPTRVANELGFGDKNRELNSRVFITQLRENLANEINYALQKHEHDARVDHRSYEEQGIDLVPQVHLGATEKTSKHNISIEIKSVYADINAQNMAIIADNPEALLSKLNSQKSTFTNEDIANNLFKYSQAPFDKTNDIDPVLFAKLDTDIQFLTKAKIITILEKIEYHDSVFTVEKIEQELKKTTTNYKQLARAIVEIKNSECVVSLGFDDSGKEKFTTANMLALERDIQTNVIKLKDNVFSLLSENAISNTLTNYELMTGKKLTDEQNKAVRHIVGKESISCIVGRAGTGKSFSLSAAKSVWDSQGNQVYGVALSGIAADGLSKDADMDSRTIASFLLSLNAGSIKLDSRSVVVMDEAGMTDSISMQKIVKSVEEAGAKLVLVGDPAQLQPVGPGATFRAILEKIGFAEIQTVYRQKEEWQRLATVEFSQGRAANGMQAYYDNDCVRMYDDAATAMDKLALDWQQMRVTSEKDISKYLVIAHRNVDVQSLNSTLRDMRVDSGEISDGYWVKNEVAGKEREIKLAQGDRIVFLKNYKELGLANGRFATVTYVNFSEAGRVIDFNVRLDGNNKEVTINPTSCNSFDYGYAATVHKTQGVTVDHSFVYGGGNLNSSLAYVAMTRHKETATFYASNSQYKTIEVLKQRISRSDVKDSVLNYLDQVDDFAGRRGLDTNQKTLKKIVVDALSKARDKIVEIVTGHKIENVSDTIEQGQATQESKINPGQLVGEYVAIRRQAGMAYEALKPKLAILGLKEISYEEQMFAIISKIPEYQDMQLLNQQLQKLAFEISNNLESSSKAIELNNINMDKLIEQSSKYVIRERVSQYMAFKSTGLEIQPGEYKRLAFEITADIPGHFRELKKQHADIAIIKQDSKQYIMDLMANSRTEAKFISFDSAVRGYLELEIKRANMDKISSSADKLLEDKAEFDNYLKQFEANFGHELKQNGGYDKANTISTNGGFEAIYDRCLNNVLTDDDLSAISRMVGYRQITELLTSRSKLLDMNVKMKQFHEECRLSGVEYSQTPEFAEALKIRISYGELAKEAVSKLNEIERALGIYNIKADELERFSNGLTNDYLLQDGLEYQKIKEHDTRRSYELAFEITKGDLKLVETVLKLDTNHISKQTKDLITAYALNKRGFTDLAEPLSANKYIDIVSHAKNTDTVFVKEEQNLQENLTEYLEAKLVLNHLFEETMFKGNRQLTEQFKAAYYQVEKLKDDLRNSIGGRQDVDYHQKNLGKLEGSLHLIYQRIISGKFTNEDYTILKRDVNQALNVQQVNNRSLKL